ncbi:hypothetical protein TNCT_78721 [Trichonephila clavata]|uniref:Uncharacterized protein n=1 Tax=Trichonephila clavata TaxID=2740835 RepID=A0A8X6IP53_TRICU|nr:hypothetical protein TNCT_78721 [Trichonephila clavata]
MPFFSKNSEKFSRYGEITVFWGPGAGKKRWISIYFRNNSDLLQNPDSGPSWTAEQEFKNFRKFSSPGPSKKTSGPIFQRGTVRGRASKPL